MDKMFPEHKGKIFSGPKQPVAILQDLMLAGYNEVVFLVGSDRVSACLLYTSPSPRDYAASRMPSSA